MTFAQKIILRNRVILYTTAVVFLLLLGADLCYVVHQPLSYSATTINGLILFLMGYGFYPAYKWIEKKILAFDDQLYAEIVRAKQGDDGEKGIFSELDQILDKEKYLVFHNFKIPGKKFDIDSVIVGPKGIVVLEIKNYTNQLVLSGVDLYAEHKGNLIYVPSKFDPRTQLEYHCKELKKYLNKNGFSSVINKAVVLYKSNSALIFKGAKTGVYIASGPDELKRYLMGLPENPVFTKEFCSKLKNILNTYYEPAKNDL